MFIVLQPFATPIFWAVLTGFVVHPYKAWLSDYLTGVLSRLTASEAFIFWDFANFISIGVLETCDSLGTKVFGRWKGLLGTLVVAGSCYLLYHWQPSVLLHIKDILMFFWDLPNHPAFASFQFYQIAILWLLLLASMVILTRENITNTSNTGSAMPVFSVQFFSFITWSVMLCYCCSFLWTPVLYVLSGTFIFVALKSGVLKEDLEDSRDNAENSRTPVLTKLRESFLRFFSEPNEASKEQELSDEAIIKRDIKDIKEEDNDEIEIPDDPDKVLEDDQCADQVDNEKNEPKKSNKPKVVLSSTPSLASGNKVPVENLTPNVGMIKHPGIAALKQQHLLPQSRNSSLNTGPQQLGGYGPTPNRSGIHNASRTFIRRRRFRTTFHNKESIEITEKASTIYIRAVFYGCIIIQFFHHPWLLNLLPFPVLIYLTRNALAYFNLNITLQKQVDRARNWLKARQDLLLPYPVKKFFQILFEMEQGVLKLLPDYVDSIVSAFLILVLIVLVIVFGVFVSFELYAETAYMVQTSGKLVSKAANSSMFKQLNATIFDSEYQTSFDNMLETAYYSGRDYISSNLHDLVGDSKDKDSSAVNEIEEKVLELWDRLYQYWLSRKEVNNNESKILHGPSVSQEAITSSVDEIFEKILDTNFFNYNSIVNFLKENMDTLRTILEQSWVLLQGNIRIFATLLLEILKLLASSSSGFVNICLSIVVYFTALFYLLVNSGSTYKPVEILTNYGHIFGEGFADALNKAINSIFSLTFR